MNNAEIEAYLAALGDLLAAESAETGIVLVGGAALLLQGFRSRTTNDIDIVAGIRSSGPSAELIPARDLPPSFTRAVQRVARDFGLPPNWINAEVSAQLTTGLPPGFLERVRWKQYSGLRVGLAGRLDLIFLKLFAAVDHDPESRHAQDLIALTPSAKELAALVGQVVDYVKEHAS